MTQMTQDITIHSMKNKVIKDIMYHAVDRIHIVFTDDSTLDIDAYSVHTPSSGTISELQVYYEIDGGAYIITT